MPKNSDLRNDRERGNFVATLINEKRMIDDTLFNYEKRFHSPLSRFIDKSPTFTTYFHIADDATTTDEGFNDVDDYVGSRSPIRYRRIEHFPLYGLDQILLQIEDTEQGLDRNYEGEATLINSTIVPSQNDMFMIPSLHDFFIFKVIAVNSDHIMNDNYYRINFALQYIDREKATWLNRQTVEKYSCVMENIGTEKKCIIRSDIYEKVQALETMYDNMVDIYISIFYNERYNCFLGELDGPCTLLYDPFQVEFMLRHDLLNRKNRLDVIVPTEHFADSKRRIKYERSIYRFFERREMALLNNFRYNTFLGANNPETGFARYVDNTVFIVDLPQPKYIPDNAFHIFSDDFVSAMKYNGPTETRYGKLLIDYIRNDEMTIDDIPLDLMEELLSLNADIEIFFLVPIILYIIQQLIEKTLKKGENLTTVEI